MSIVGSKLYKLCRLVKTEDIHFKDESISEEKLNSIKLKLLKIKTINPTSYDKHVVHIVTIFGENNSMSNMISLGYDAMTPDNRVDVDEMYDKIVSTFSNLDSSRPHSSAIFVGLVESMRSLIQKVAKYVPWQPLTEIEKVCLNDFLSLLVVLYGDQKEVTVVFSCDENNLVRLKGIWPDKESEQAVVVEKEEN